MNTEEQNKDVLINAIKPFFNISEERWGKHANGDNVRIDLILQPKNYKEWANGKDSLLGVEIKPDYDHFNERTGLIVQAIDYKMSKFRLKGGAYKSIPIFMYPNPLSHPKIDAYFLERLLGKMNIGFINYKDYKDCFEFRICDTPIFDTIEGARKMALKFKFETTFGRQ